MFECTYILQVVGEGCVYCNLNALSYMCDINVFLTST